MALFLSLTDSGILLSNSVMRKVQKSLDWCVKNVISKDDSNNLGQCVIHASQIQCSETIQVIFIVQNKGTLKV